MKRLLSKTVVVSQIFLLVIVWSVAWAQAGPVVPGEASTGAVSQSLEKEGVRKLPPLPEIIIQEESGRRLQGAEGVTLDVKKIVFEGNEVILDDELEAIVEEYLDKTIEVNDLQKIADAVSSYYIKKLYVLTKVYLPPQTIEDGTVLIKIREGRLGKVIVRGNQRYSEELIRNVMEIIRERGALKTTDLERALLLLMDYPAMTVKATLSAGEKPGTTDIIVDVTETKIWGIGADYNNFGSKYVGRHRFGVSGSLYSPLKKGDQLKVRFDTGVDEELYYGRFEYTYPINYSGTKVGVSYSYLEYESGEELEVLEAEGNSRVASIWVSHPFMRCRSINWFADFGLDYRNSSNDMLGYELYKDELVIARAGSFVDWVDRLNGRNTFTVNLRQGIRDDNIESRQDGDAMFTKVEFGYNRHQLFPYGVNATLSAAGQISSDRLPNSEMLHVGGAGTVRGYAQGEYSGDNGLYGNLEVRVPLWQRDFRWRGQEKCGFMLQFAAFLDAASVSYKKTGISEVTSSNLYGQGLGLRFALTPYLQAKIDWAKSIGGEAPMGEDIESNGVWYFQLSAFY